MTAGFAAEEYIPVLSVEFNLHAAATYAANFGEDHTVFGDIKSVKKRQVPKADVVIGGPPCQGFSNLGSKDINDPRNQLWREYLRIVGIAKPDVFVIENVDRFLKSPEFQLLLDEADNGSLKGYKLSYGHLNAADFGVAQRRIRTIVIGSRVGKIELPKATHARNPEPGSELLPWNGTRTRIKGLPSRHQAPRDQRMSFDHARLRRRTGRPCRFRLPGADLLAEADRRAHGLFVDVSDRRKDARQFHGLPRHDRSVAAAVQAGAGSRPCCALMPGLQRMMGEFKVSGPVKVRPADLCVTDGYLQPGIVLAGDAFSTSCPAAGTGTTKVFTDVERLCNFYIPQWLATDGMDERQDGGVLRRSGKAGVRGAEPCQGLPSAFAVDRQRPVMARAALGALCGAVVAGSSANRPGAVF